MKTVVMEKILDQTIDLSITRIEKNLRLKKPFWSKGGTNE